MLDKKIPEPDLKNFKSDCIPTSKANLFVLRILGVPSAIDFIPHFANRNGRHYWATAIDPRINSTQVYQVGIYKAPKIYRRTYSHNPTAKPGKREYVPYFFLDPFNKDVTDLYIPTSEIRLSAPGIRNIRHGYLAIFNDFLSWQPIACSKPAGQEIIFPKMGKEIALPAGSLYRQKRNGPLCSSSHTILRRNCASDYCQQRLFTVYEARQEISLTEEKATIGTPLLSIHISKPPTIRISNPLIPSARSATSPIIAINLFRSIPLCLTGTGDS